MHEYSEQEWITALIRDYPAFARAYALMGDTEVVWLTPAPGFGWALREPISQDVAGSYGLPRWRGEEVCAKLGITNTLTWMTASIELESYGWLSWYDPHLLDEVDPEDDESDAYPDVPLYSEDAYALLNVYAVLWLAEHHGP